jgi:hypothetical protein
MDEDAWRDTYREFNERRCVFEKTVLARMGACPHAYKFNLAEREGVQCLKTPAHELCAAFHAGLLEKARFALRLAAPQMPLTHGKAARLATGGLLGLRVAMGGEDGMVPVADIHGLIQRSAERFGGLERLPYGDIVRGIARFQPRPRRIRIRTE